MKSSMACASVDRQRRSLILGTGAGGALPALTALADLAQAGPGAARMPVIFVGHGSPANALRDNAFTRHLRDWGSSLPRPRAILAVSAHWLTSGVTAVGVHERPPTMHDFGGFPAELHAMTYPAPGAPSVAREAAGRLRNVRVVATDTWGLDHGTWTVLHHVFPEADVPVFQLSIDYDRPGRDHLAIGRDLAALRDSGVLIVGSGNVVHNLRATDRGAADGEVTRPWARDFDAAVKSALGQRDDTRLAEYPRLDGSAALAVPTPDHYLPLLYAVGAAAADEPARHVFEGFQSGTLSMRCVQFG